MENNISATNWAHNEMLKIENRLFWGKIIGYSIGYLVITLWLNSIRAFWSLWLVWPLIIIQFALYFSIFIASYQRSIVFGLNKNFAFILFFILAVLGRINDWELLVIPVLVIVMLAFSATNKKISKEKQIMFEQK
jgi:hypothetical protein